jgi:glycine reductase
MAQETKKMAEFAFKLHDGTLERDPEKEGFFERGWMVLKKHEDMASKRAVDMLLDKLAGRPFKTEIPMPHDEKAVAPPPVKDLSKATVVLITDGALCPQGNPDGMKTGTSTTFYVYSTEGRQSLTKRNTPAFTAALTRRTSWRTPTVSCRSTRCGSSSARAL